MLPVCYQWLLRSVLYSGSSRRGARRARLLIPRAHSRAHHARLPPHRTVTHTHTYSATCAEHSCYVCRTFLWQTHLARMTSKRVVKGNGGAKFQKRQSWLYENWRRLLGTINKKKSSGRYCHVLGSSPHKPPGGSWLKEWQKNAKQLPGKCRFLGCENDATVGAHIQKSFSDIERCTWFIVPACQSCNTVDRRFEYKGKQAGGMSFLKPNTFKLKVAKKTKEQMKLLLGKWQM